MGIPQHIQASLMPRARTPSPNIMQGRLGPCHALQLAGHTCVHSSAAINQYWNFKTERACPPLNMLLPIRHVGEAIHAIMHRPHSNPSYRDHERTALNETTLTSPAEF
jgi:hypothetical protein